MKPTLDPDMELPSPKKIKLCKNRPTRFVVKGTDVVSGASLRAICFKAGVLYTWTGGLTPVSGKFRTDVLPDPGKTCAAIATRSGKGRKAPPTAPAGPDTVSFTIENPADTNGTIEVSNAVTTV